MKINFENDFNDYILKRGYEYYCENRVSNVVVNNNIVSAIVIGNYDYKVELEIIDNIFIDGECSCPYFESGEYCKHIAALLYYLNEKGIDKENNDYNLENIVNVVPEKEIRNFIYENLKNDIELLNRFRIEFSKYFPKLSKEEYEKKIYNAIDRCCNIDGYIDYNNTFKYEHAMNEFIDEASKLVDNEDYKTALIIIMTILDSIPNTNIDDSSGSTSVIAENSIEIIFDILDEIDNKNNDILKMIFDYVIDELKTDNLYNYGVDLEPILEYFIYDKLYLDDIKEFLEIKLDSYNDKKYFYNRINYVNYLTKIYEFKEEKEKIIQVLEKYSYDSDVFIKYIDELIKNNKVFDAIKKLEERLDENNYDSKTYANKLSEIYLANNKINEYKDILYKIFYKFDKYDIDTYLKIKKLYNNKDWDIEKNKIIENLKKDKSSEEKLTKIFIEEKMYDELYFNICNYTMNYIISYEKYLLPKYNNELLYNYKYSCLKYAEYTNNRREYRVLARNVNHIIQMKNSNETVKSLLKEINEKYFVKRPAMYSEFNIAIKNLNKYIK